MDLERDGAPAEDASRPLSDEEVRERLASRGLVLDRLPDEDHPIALYRRVLGIPAAEARARRGG